MQNQSDFEIKQLTLGDLIISVADCALEVTEDEDTAYEIASRVLVKLLESSAPGTGEELIAAYCSTVFH